MESQKIPVFLEFFGYPWIEILSASYAQPASGLALSGGRSAAPPSTDAAVTLTAGPLLRFAGPAKALQTMEKTQAVA